MRVIYIGLVFLIICAGGYVQAMVTVQEIATLKAEIQNLIPKKRLEGKNRQTTELENTFERLQQIDDMPLSRPEADQIIARLHQLK